ncbi:hypothetical protein KAR91_66875 [Candidatus Pacearchaeota archaeon]|nr:hypothetical protein [Candidatus Pacearchaeota archaeon]
MTPNPDDQTLAEFVAGKQGYVPAIFGEQNFLPIVRLILKTKKYQALRFSHAKAFFLTDILVDENPTKAAALALYELCRKEGE